MINIDAHNHVSGRSIYLDDLPELQGTVFALPFFAASAHAHIVSIDYAAALASDGIVTIISAQDIPGENEIGGIIRDEPLFATDTIHFWGQPLGIIIGHSEQACRWAREKIKIDIEALPVVTDPRVAYRDGEIIGSPRKFVIGNTEATWQHCKYIVEDSVDVNGQEHLYIETQGAYAWPKEDDCICIASSTQGPTAVQKTVANVLGIGMHQVEVNVRRLGGGFGGKEDQATSWAVMVALAAKILKKPVKMVLHRMDDMLMTGKRHPYSVDFKIGLDDQLMIKAYQVQFYQNAGAAADLSPAILERTLFHCTNAYHIPNVSAIAYSCRTHLPPNTAFRGFGGPQGKFVIESAIARIAEVLQIAPHIIQQKNLLKEGDVMPYGQVMQQVLAKASWDRCMKIYNFGSLQEEATAFNAANERYKKGIAVQPICFGISFTNTMMNHARALVHIYGDGSVVVSTGAVEMGQGVNTKLLQVATTHFGINPSLIKLESTNTLRIANTSPTAASAGADLNGKALEIACQNIKSRLLNVAAEILNTDISSLNLNEGWVSQNGVNTAISWHQLVILALQKRVNLSDHAHYATPVIHYDKSKEHGHPFAYHVYGTAVVGVTVDCLRGTYHFDYVKLVHDFGKSMNTDVDNGQVEGGLVQGIGWMTMEEIVHDENGKLRSNALSTYKIPDIYSVPDEISIHHLETEGSDLAIQKSKAVGEPPLMYGIGAYFAIRNAIKAFNSGKSLKIDAPYTPEKVLMDLYQGKY